MPDVIHVIGALDRGGAETVALGLCQQISPAEVRQTFVCLSGREGAIADEFRAAGATVIPMSLRRPLRFGWTFFHLVRELRPRSVVSHVSLASGPILLIARLAGARQRIARMHSEGDGRTGSWRHAYRQLARLTVILGSTHVLGVTAGSLTFGIRDYKVLARLLKVQLGVLPNGVDTRKFHYDYVLHQSPKTIVRVLHVGRAAPEKNRGALPGIQRAFAGMKPNQFVLFGADTDLDLGHYEQESLVVAGFTDNIDIEFQTADVLILPSLREGLPGAILEALAAGVPVVASNLPGIREIQESTGGVELVDPTAPPSVWAAALMRASDLDADARATIAAKFARSPYTLEQSVMTWLALWLTPADSRRLAGADLFEAASIVRPPGYHDETRPVKARTKHTQSPG